MSNSMRKALSYVTAVLLAVSCLAQTVCADIAPDPIRRAVSYMPLILIVVAIAAVLLIIKLFFVKK